MDDKTRKDTAAAEEKLSLEAIIAEFGGGKADAADTEDVQVSDPEIQALLERVGMSQQAEACDAVVPDMPEAVPEGKMPPELEVAPEVRPPDSGAAPTQINVAPEEDPFVPYAAELHDTDAVTSDYEAYAGRNAHKLNPEAAVPGAAEAELPEETGILHAIFTKFINATARKGREENDPRPGTYDAEQVTDADTEGIPDPEELAPDGYTPIAAAMHYGKGINNYQMKGVAAIFLALLMAVISMAFERGAAPGFLAQASNLTGALLFLQLAALYAGLEILVTGIRDIVRLKPGVEALVTIASLVSMADTIRILFTGDAGAGLPYGAVCAFAIGCALLGTKLIRNGMKISLRTAGAAAVPNIIAGRHGLTENGSTLLGGKRETEGFLRKLRQMDLGEYAYGMAAPILLAMALVFALLATLAKGRDFLHCLAALTAACASFSGLIAYGLPFSMLSKKLLRVGAAIAGWAGACEISEASGLILTDTDLFPPGSLSVSGMRILQKADAGKVISYTGSIICGSGSGLSELFMELMRTQGCTHYHVERFSCYEGGGIGATVCGEEVIIGSFSFMNLMGVRLPQNMGVKNAVYTAIGQELAGVFSINYVPVRSVQEALPRLLGTNVQMLFAVRDFNITPLMLQNKFKVSMESMELLTFEERYALSSASPDPGAKPLAVLCRDGLGPVADVVTGGVRLKRAVTGNVFLSIASSVIGLVLLFYLCWTGAVAAMSVTNILTYQLIWLLLVLINSWTVRGR